MSLCRDYVEESVSPEEDLIKLKLLYFGHLTYYTFMWFSVAESTLISTD